METRRSLVGCDPVAILYATGCGAVQAAASRTHLGGIGITVKLSTLSRPEVAHQLARLCASVASENKGRDVLLLDLRKITPLVDFFVIASGTSRRQIHTMADEIDRTMNLQGEEKIGIEGYGESRWVLLDYGDIVVHLFDDETRQYYDLENLWGESPRIDWAVARSASED